MEVYRTEEEQVAAIKRWWKENGSSLLIGVGLALAIIFGWKAWQANVASKQSAAAALYQDVLIATTNPDEEKGRASVNFIAEQLRESHSGSPYAIYASLIQARTSVDQGEHSKAIEQLNWALQKSKGALKTLVEYRLAQTQWIAGDAQAALATLKGIQQAQGFAGLIGALEGDILHSKGDLDGARAAYRKASDAVASGAQVVPLLDLKMAELGLTENR